MPSDVSCLYKSREGYEAMMALYEATLAKSALPFECLFVPTRHGETHVIAAGARDLPAFILLPGGNANAAGWTRHFAAFSPHFRVYAPDVIGWSGKSAPTRLRMKSPGYAEWLIDVLDAVKVDQASFMGVSAGGWFILKLGAHAPQRIRKAVFVSSAGFTGFRLSLGFAWATLSYMFFPSRNTSRKFVAWGFGPDATSDENLIEGMYLLRKHYRMHMMNFRAFPDDELRNFTAPSLLIMGKNDGFFRADKVVARARKLMPNVIAEIDPDARHGFPSLRMDAVNARILEFLKETA